MLVVCISIRNYNYNDFKWKYFAKQIRQIRKRSFKNIQNFVIKWVKHTRISHSKHIWPVHLISAMMSQWNRFMWLPFSNILFFVFFFSSFSIDLHINHLKFYYFDIKANKINLIPIFTPLKKQNVNTRSYACFLW